MLYSGSKNRDLHFKNVTSTAMWRMNCGELRVKAGGESELQRADGGG